MRITFFCTTKPQAEMFLRVTGEFEKRDQHDIAWITADEFVSWSVTPFLRDIGVDAVPLVSRVGKRSFVDLPLYKMWWSLSRELSPQLETLLRHQRPDVVFVGNDRGLIEKRFIRVARRLGAKTILIQDGLLWRHEVRSYAARRSRTTSLRMVGRTWGKRWLRRVMGALGRPDLAPSYMGQGGCDRICVMGESTKKVLEARAVDPADIVVTGQPRYDGTRMTTEDIAGLKKRLGIPSEHVVVTFFGVTADADGRVSNTMSPPDLASELVNVVQRVASGHVSVILKPHPREEAAPYERVARQEKNAIAVCDESSIDLVQISDIGISFVCTTIAETALFGGTPVVLRMGFNGSVSGSLGLPENALLEFSAPTEMFDCIQTVLESGVGLPSANADVARRLVYQPDSGAAAAVVAVADGLVKGDVASVVPLG